MLDALEPYGVTDIDMPASPERVWRAIQEATVMIPAPFDYERAESVDRPSSCSAARRGREAHRRRALAPAADEAALRGPSLLVDIGRIEELGDVRDAGDRLAIGALTRHHDLATTTCSSHEHCADRRGRRRGLIGDPQVRHRGTIGGSVAHGDPASDLPTVLLALDAELAPGARRRADDRRPADFFRGLFETALGPQDVLTEMRVPKLGPEVGWSYVKFARRAQDWATVGVAAVVAGRTGRSARRRSP